MSNTLPALGFSLASLKNFEEANLARRVLETFLECRPPLRPKVLAAVEPATRPFSSRTLNEAIGVWLNSGANANDQQDSGHRRGTLVLRTSSPLGGLGGYLINWRRAKTDPGFSFVSGDCALATIRGMPSLLGEFVSLFRDLAGLTDPTYGSVKNMSFKGWDLPFDFKVRLPDIPWLFILGKPYLDMFGRERVMSTPAHSVQEWGEHRVAIQATPSVLEPVPEPVRSAIRAHLGDAAFMCGGRWRYKDGWAPSFDFSEVSLP